MPYDTFVKHALLQAPGWQAVYYLCETGVHIVAPIHALALVTRRTRDAATDKRVPPLVRPWRAKEVREIVGLEYHPADRCWVICDTIDNYCGLLMPTWTLADFEREAECRHAPVAQKGGP
jgi:hypothetical protein